MTATTDFAAIKTRQKAAWASGDYAVIGTTLQIVGETLCEAVDLRSGQRVLDVAAGNGNATLAAARRFAEVVSTDYVAALLERAAERAKAERLAVTFRQADAEALPFDDASFDVVLSTFGVMFTPDQQQAARELLRVCRPGGTIAMTNWTPDCAIAEVQSAAARFAPPPAGVPSPMLWGTEAHVRELLGDGISSLRVARKSFVMRFRSVEHWFEFHSTYLGPVRKMVESLDPGQRQAAGKAVRDVASRLNRSGDATLVMPVDYLEVVAIRR